MSLGGIFLEPFVLLAVGDYWTAVVLRAELIERGYEVLEVFRAIDTAPAIVLLAGAGAEPPRVALVKFALEHERCAREQGHAVRK